MNFYDLITTGGHKEYRTEYSENLAEKYAAAGLSPTERMTDRFVRMCGMQKPLIFNGEQIVFMRSVAGLPDVFTPDEWADIKASHRIHELGYMSNVTPDYARVLSLGLLEVRESANEYQKRQIDAIIDLSDRYKAEAIRQNRADIAAVLERVPRYPATNFREALQFFRILHFALWLEGNYHVTTGRFDLYMYPYFKADADNYTHDGCLELLCDFFLSFNKDSDLYPGVQQGDNGQSMVLGGIDENGRDTWNELSQLCLEASAKNLLIDPKINVRVGKNTPPERYTACTRLTAAGLGFPQYSNDDAVIKGLEALGYAHSDAVNYGVAACWEFIVPGRGCDVANIDALSFPAAVDRAMKKRLRSCGSFDCFLDAVRDEIKAESERITSSLRDLWFVPSPFLSLFFDCPRGDISEGSVYNNFGIHGTGIATACDSLAVIEKYVFAEKSVAADALIEAIESDFALHGELLPLLRYEAPKMGVRGSGAERFASVLLNCFSASLEGKVNCRGGVWRAGTGSAMYYLWHAAEIGASPDGRRKGEAFGTNYSPSLFTRTDSPVAVIDAFTSADLSHAMNGGPLTLEFDAKIFETEDTLVKVGSLVRYFIYKGGHQLQLNAVSREKLLDAQVHPERYRSLIVRVWGWSAYFTELDKPYQDHVIARAEYTV